MCIQHDLEHGQKHYYRRGEKNTNYGFTSRPLHEHEMNRILEWLRCCTAVRTCMKAVWGRLCKNLLLETGDVKLQISSNISETADYFQSHRKGETRNGRAKTQTETWSMTWISLSMSTDFRIALALIKSKDGMSTLQFEIPAGFNAQSWQKWRKGYRSEKLALRSFHEWFNIL